MRNLKHELRNKSVNYQKLLDYGFLLKDGKYTYKSKILNGEFEAIITISENDFNSKLIDVQNDEEYILVDVEDSTGEFVGKVRKEYDELINDILEKSFEIEIYKSRQTKEIVNFIKKKYNDNLEFLWDDENSIVRNKINQKWYGVFMKVSEEKLGLDRSDVVEIMDLRYQKNETDKIVDNLKIFPGYHMNKSSWITVKLDNTLSTKEIEKLIDNSYTLSSRKQQDRTCWK